MIEWLKKGYGKNLRKHDVTIKCSSACSYKVRIRINSKSVQNNIYGASIGFEGSRLYFKFGATQNDAWFFQHDGTWLSLDIVDKDKRHWFEPFEGVHLLHRDDVDRDLYFVDIVSPTKEDVLRWLNSEVKVND